MLKFINQSYRKQIKVLYFINNSLKPVSVDEIATYMKISNRSILSIIGIIENDIVNLNFTLKKTNDKKYYLQAKKKNGTVYLDEYILICGKKSLVFLIVEELFFIGKINTVEFCNDIYISHATFSRAKKQLSILLEEYNLELSIYIRDGILGEEYKIRIFYYLFFNDFYNSIRWPFEKNIEIELENYFKLKLEKLIGKTSNEQKRKFYMLIYTIKKRVMLGHVMKDSMSSFEGIKNYNMYTEFIKEYFATFKVIDSKIIKNETDFFIYAIYTQEIYIDDLEVLFEQNSSEVNITILWIEEFKKVFKKKLTMDEESFLRKSLYISHLNFEYFYNSKRSFSKYELFDFESKILKNEFYENSEKLFLNLMKKKIYIEYIDRISGNISKKKIISEYFYYICVYFYGLEEIKAISIFISESIGQVNKNILEKQLEIVFGNNIKIKEEIDDEIELIITNYGNLESKIEELVFFSFRNKKEFYRIANKIQEKIYKKLL